MHSPLARPDALRNFVATAQQTPGEPSIRCRLRRSFSVSTRACRSLGHETGRRKKISLSVPLPACWWSIILRLGTRPLWKIKGVRNHFSFRHPGWRDQEQEYAKRFSSAEPGHDGLARAQRAGIGPRPRQSSAALEARMAQHALAM